ncbi:hypothetical protein F383_39418 [Gossypium arboreum]|uniref:Uncharacterized protein n=1 Tax=Gossypium arboreum TaxID=29729 RepID=A0A0B0MPN6_GOSAR|nr:hypothetical protein F383_39418 [Gossypium arboreum]
MPSGLSPDLVTRSNAFGT